MRKGDTGAPLASAMIKESPPVEDKLNERTKGEGSGTATIATAGFVATLMLPVGLQTEKSRHPPQRASTPGH